jgi:hypothetical protein
MDNHSKPEKNAAKSGEHPEAKKHVSRGVPDQNSSKAASTGPRDARTGHDKDGNEQLARGKTQQPKRQGGQ